MSTSSVQPATARIRSIFQQLGKAEPDPMLKNVDGTVEFDVNGVGSWQVTIDHGAISVSEGTPKAADFVLASNEDEFLRIVSGKDNIVTALLRGELNMSGNLTLGLAVRRLLPVDS